MKINVSGVEIEYIIRKVKYLRLTVNKDGEVKLIAPKGTPYIRALSFAESKRDWIQKKLNTFADKVSNAPPANVFKDETALRNYINNRIEYWKDKTGLVPVSVRFRKMTSRHGVCNTKNRKITFSTDMINKSAAFIDYVCLHEIIHLKIANHSAAFYSEIEKYMPDWFIMSGRKRKPNKD